MRSSSNPAFRNLPTGGGYGGYAGFGQPEQAGYQQAPPPLTSERPMTIDDVVTKTGMTLALVATTAVITYLMKAWGLLIPAAIIGLVLALVIMFKKMPSPPLVLAYAAVEGVFLGAFSGIIGNMIDGMTDKPGQGVVVIGQAIIGTLGVFFGMLVVYKTGAIRVTPKFTKWIVGAIIGVGVLMLFNLVMSFFTDGGLGLRSGGPLAIIFSLVCIGLAAFSFLIDFDAADQAIRAGVPAKFAWQIAFGLTVTLVWLYTEILRLLSYFNSD
ncbi:Bax inhibitor-1/YccA family protein [Lentzea sp. NBC_00516]|uniref:Bax inhibitor-1/YccA family protein n=1 Tax=Lentzea sp. NBC_00516 TaxID=2903582 RepID=UPI002E814B67|nr:Bax inhibitor-1/YccA family protein [Lentzea sp. NBC_00516]WUD21989.1 Bax inhibitor-1/YccA family protein [Lentzea sp. NBC_00516]